MLKALLIIALAISLYAQVELLRVIGWYEGRFGFVPAFAAERPLLALGVALNLLLLSIVSLKRILR